MTLGDYILAYRNEHSISMDKFADLSGISKGYISMLERNRTQRGDEPSPSIEMYRSVAKILGVDVDELIRNVTGNIALWETSDHKEEKPIPISKDGPLTPAERRIMDLVRQLTPENKELFAEKLEFLLDFQQQEPVDRD